MELDPKYVDVIVRRWQDYAGKKATRQIDGAAFGMLAGALNADDVQTASS